MLIVLCCVSGKGLAQGVQQNQRFDSAYFYIATTLAAKDVEKAINEAQGLFSTATDSLQRVRGLMLLANLKKSTGRLSEALQLAIEGEALAGKIHNNDWRVRIAGFLSTTFRELGLLRNGRKYIDIAEKASDQAPSAPLMKVFINQEQAYYHLEDKQYTQALEKIQKAIQLFLQIPENKRNRIIQATSYQVAGLCYLNLDSVDQAEAYLEQALAILGDQDTELKGFIYQNLGDRSLKMKDDTSAGRYLNMALAYSNSSDNFNLKLATFKSLHQYYLASKDPKQAILYQTKYIELVESRTSLVKEVSNKVMEQLDEEYAKNTRIHYLWYIISGVVVCGALFSLYYFNRLRKKERQKYLAYIDKLQNEKQIVANSSVVPEDTEEEPASLAMEMIAADDSSPTEAQTLAASSLVSDKLTGDLEEERKERLSIPKETEKRILVKLVELEQERFYLRKDITLSLLCAAIDVNPKYLSLVIRKYKGKDFNNYINELRVKYIIEKLRSGTDYRSYKIAYLADEAGFSSHSKFALAFKALTGISPSTFIQNLRRDIRQ